MSPKVFTKIALSFKSPKYYLSNYKLVLLYSYIKVPFSK